MALHLSHKIGESEKYPLKQKGMLGLRLATLALLISLSALPACKDCQNINNTAGMDTKAVDADKTEGEKAEVEDDPTEAARKLYMMQQLQQASDPSLMSPGNPSPLAF